MTEGLAYYGQALLDVFMQGRQELGKRPLGHAVPRWDVYGSRWNQDSGNLGPNSARQARSVDIATTTRVVDGDACVLARLEQQLLRALLARGIHIVADRRAKSGGIRPLVMNTIGKRGKERLDLAIERSSPAAVKTLKGHYLDQERGLHRLLIAVLGIAVPVLHHAHETFPLIAIGLVRCGRLVLMDLRVVLIHFPDAVSGISYWSPVSNAGTASTLTTR